MIYKTISAVLVGVLLSGSMAAETQPPAPVQTVAKMQQILRKAQEKNKNVKIILQEKIDNQRKFKGAVSEISDAGFSFTEARTGKTMTWAYKDIQEVNQTGISKGTIITTVVLVAAGIIIVGLILSYRDNA